LLLFGNAEEDAQSDHNFSVLLSMIRFLSFGFCEKTPTYHVNKDNDDDDDDKTPSTTISTDGDSFNPDFVG